MRRGLLARVTAASLLLALLVGIPFVFLIQAIRELQDSAELSARGEAAVSEARELERLLIDAQTGSRGFVISGDETFLEPWQEARTALPVKARQLKSMLQDPGQRRRAEVIEAALQTYLDEWSEPIVAQARRDRAAAARSVASGRGDRQVQALRALFREFVAAQTAETSRRADRVEREARQAIWLSLGGLAGSALVVLLAGAYLARSVIVPIRRSAASARQLAAGDLTVRTPRGGPPEVDDLAASFNDMAAALEQNRDELESQNNELEAQTIELEHQQARLEEVNAELEVRRLELERILLDVNEQKERVEALFRYGELLASTSLVERFAAAALAELAELASAEIAALYVRAERRDGEFWLEASRGLRAERLSEALRPGDGLAGRAVEEGRQVVASHGETGLRLTVFGEDVALRHELHVPLVRGDEVLGLVSLGRVGDRPFSEPDRELIGHLADQTSVALANALALQRVERLAQVNRTVLDSTPVGIELVDHDGRSLLANAAFERLVGARPAGSVYDVAEEAARKLADPDAYVRFMRDVAADPQRTGMHELVARDGSSSLQLYTAPVLDDDEVPTGRIFVVQDVTAEREAERLKTDLMATVSHELRTPLASILGFSELLAVRELDAATSRRYAGTIHGEAQRLTNLISDFLDLQRIEAGGLRIELAPIELAPLLQQTVELYSAQSAQHTIRLEAPDDPLVVLGERERIAQVVGNLLSNAVKYSPDGGTITVRARAKDGTVRISVRDKGLGIPEAQQGQIFDKFFRVDSSDTRRIGGTGLGLALSREIVEAHGGRMGFESVEGEGSTFWLDLPAGLPASVPDRVLMIADEAEPIDHLTTWLEEDGFRVSTATSGSDGLALATRDRPALVCLDVCLDGRPDGWDVLEELKSRPDTSAIPVVLFTAGNGHDRAAALGAADVLQKPFSADELRRTIERVLPPGGAGVLIVDDDAAVRQLVHETLAREGLRIREAGDGDEALRAVAEELPDAIVLDLAMPVVDGFEVLAELRREPRTRDVPVVVLTGKRLSPDERRELRRRAVALMEKTAYSAPELRSLVRAALGTASV